VVPKGSSVRARVNAMSAGAGYGIECLRDDGVAFVVLSGEIDLAAAPDLHEVLLAEVGSRDRTVVDLGAVSFLDSSGLSILVTALRRAQERCVDLFLCSPSPFAARVLELAGLADAFKILSSRADACGKGD
jgi:anti-sigma B factor antagonist